MDRKSEAVGGVTYAAVLAKDAQFTYKALGQWKGITRRVARELVPVCAAHEAN